jgi:hypothetical protein
MAIYIASSFGMGGAELGPRKVGGHTVPDHRAKIRVGVEERGALPPWNGSLIVMPLTFVFIVGRGEEIDQRIAGVILSAVGEGNDPSSHRNRPSSFEAPSGRLRKRGVDF